MVAEIFTVSAIATNEPRRTLRVPATRMPQKLQGSEFVATAHTVNPCASVHTITPEDKRDPQKNNQNQNGNLLFSFRFSFTIRRYECGGRKNFWCMVCGKGFAQGSHLKRHTESAVCVRNYFQWYVFNGQTKIRLNLIMIQAQETVLSSIFCPRTKVILTLVEYVFTIDCIRILHWAQGCSM